MKTYTDEEIYEAVSTFYKGKGLDKGEFSNRLHSIKLIIKKGYLMSEAIDFLSVREHWWECGKEQLATTKARTRGQIKSILKKLNLAITKHGLKELRN